MKSQVLSTISDVRTQIAALRANGCTVGLVPTMGALHPGHAALIERSRGECGAVVVSIFVNPIQFDRRNDYDAYSIDLAEDVKFCEALGVGIVFAPPAEEMYPHEQHTFVDVEGVTEHLCGKFRPGHFRGVATVVAKLLNIVAPDKAYFGEKDAQQLAVIERMVADLNMPVEMVAVPTVREPDGLALSSRNKRLSPEERKLAPVLYEGLMRGAEAARNANASVESVRSAALSHLQKHAEFQVEYLEVVDAASMVPVETISGPVRIAAAAWLGGTRLIDNIKI